MEDSINIEYLLESVRASDPERGGKMHVGLAIREDECTRPMKELLKPLGDYTLVNYDELMPAAELLSQLKRALQMSDIVVVSLDATPTAAALKQFLSISRYHALDLSEVSASRVSFFPLAPEQRIIVCTERSVLNEIADPLFYQCFGPVATIQ